MQPMELDHEQGFAFVKPIEKKKSIWGVKE